MHIRTLCVPDQTDAEHLMNAIQRGALVLGDKRLRLKFPPAHPEAAF